MTREVAIIGGGFTGAAVAYHLARIDDQARITVFEPRPRLGAGLAYGDLDRTHRINVPASRMSLDPDDQTQFARWLAGSDALASDPEAAWGDEAYPARAVFGRYVGEMLQPMLDAGRVRHVAEEVVALERAPMGWGARTASGVSEAQVAVIATTHPAPDIPKPLACWRGDLRLIVDALAPGALDHVDRDDAVLIVGTGLTSADIIASLDARGHRGHVTLFSRRGLRSRGHAPTVFPAEGDFVTDPARDASALVARVRRAVRRATLEGRSWRPVIDAVREQGQDIWRSLTPEARRRFVKRVRPYWDAHRYRVAPQLEALVDRKLADGSLELSRARLASVERQTEGFVVRLTDSRGAPGPARRWDWIVLATGPAHAAILDARPYLGGLARDGLISLDPNGLGLASTLDGRAIRADGGSGELLLIAGPLARGAFGELMGLPHVAAHARLIARQIAAARLPFS